MLAIAALALALSSEAPAAPGAQPPAAPAPPSTASRAVERIETGPAAEGDASGPAAEGSEAPLQVSMEAAAGTRGEQALEILARWQGERLALGLGGETVAAATAGARHGVLAQAELSVGAAALRAELRARPPQSGASRVGGELGLRFEGESGSVDLSARATSLSFERTPPSLAPGGPGAAFTSVEGAAELERTLTSALSLGLRVAATAAELRWRGRAPPRPWDALGAAALEWPGRWEAAATARLRGGGARLSLSAGAAAPAAARSLAACSQMRLEVEAGRTTLGVFLGGARQWPGELWRGEAGFAAAVRLGGESAP